MGLLRNYGEYDVDGEDDLGGKYSGSIVLSGKTHKAYSNSDCLVGDEIASPIVRMNLPGVCSKGDLILREVIKPFDLKML